MSTKYIFISGGVISGIGKGITTASLGALLKAAGYSVSPMKIDMYFNMDAGTLGPQEHGEVFVTADGMETDQDLGNYERFLDTDLTKSNYLTNGLLYDHVLKKERAFEYEGITVQPIPHITNEIINRVKAAGKALKADIVLVELGGTVGDYENVLFLEASRIMKLKNPADVLQVHLGYLPIPGSLGEMKSKPIQQSVRALNSMGIQPDMVIGRAAEPIDKKRRQKIALFTNMEPEDVISNPDVESIYEVPLILAEQQVAERLLAKMGLPVKSADLGEWKTFNKAITSAKKPVKIGLVGKYFATGDYVLEDVYVSVIESLKHAAWHFEVKPELIWIDSEKIQANGIGILEDLNGIVVTGGFGGRAIEGMIASAQYAREHTVPFLGLCYGLQMAVIEFARHVAGLAGANTAEAEPETQHPVIHVMPDQAKKMLAQDYGGSMRLGAWECHLVPGTIASKAYGKDKIWERHRHRYEFNNDYKSQLEKYGLRISGTSPDGKLVEIVELDSTFKHPFYVGVQFHPEFLSRPLKPHPLFRDFIKAAIPHSQGDS